MTEAADPSTKEDDVGNLDAHGPLGGHATASGHTTSAHDSSHRPLT